MTCLKFKKSMGSKPAQQDQQPSATTQCWLMHSHAENHGKRAIETAHTYMERTKVPTSALQGKSDYFLDSADRIHFFIEKEAADEDLSGCV